MTRPIVSPRASASASSPALRSAPRLLVTGSLIWLLGCASTAPPSGAAGGSRPHVWRPATGDGSGPVVAVVGAHKITKHEIDSLLASAPAGVKDQYKDPGQYRQLVDRLVEQEAIYQAAKAAGTEQDSGYKAEVAMQARQILMRRYYQNALENLPEIPDSAARRYYDEHQSDFRVPGRARVRHILLTTQAKAKEVRRKLTAGALWDQTCAKHSTDKGSSKNGGTIGYVASDTDVVPGVGKAPAIVAAAFGLKEGETSEPLKSERGWHLIRVDNVSEPTIQPFEESQDRIRSNLEGDHRDAYGAALVDSLKRFYGAMVFEDSIEAAVKPPTTPADLFAEAQATPSAQDRIALFRSIASRYPEDKSAIQAAFMVGFTYAEELAEYAAAREAFQEFIKKYPDSDLVASAKWMMENMETPSPPLGGVAPGDSLKTKP